MKLQLGSLILVLALTSSLLSEDWPRFRGPRGDGTSAESAMPLKWGPKENVAWKVELPGPGSSSPIVVGDRVFVTSFSGKLAKDIVRHVQCYSRRNGKILWHRSFPGPQ